MVPRVWSLMRFLIKGSVAGGAVYLVYDQELLGPSDKSQAVLQKAEEVVPPAMYQFGQYVCEQTGLKMPQLPAPPKFNFHIRDTWNSAPTDLKEEKGWRFQGGVSKVEPPLRMGHIGAHRVTSDKRRPCPTRPVSACGTDAPGTGIITVMSALSAAPSKAREYSKEGWAYLKERTK
ncbi:MICOS complex subunit MIC13 isoform X1 [Halichoerus grypus]